MVVVVVDGMGVFRYSSYSQWSNVSFISSILISLSRF